MIALPPELQALLTREIWHAIIVFLRVSALVSLLPAFGERSVPIRVKLGIAVAFTMIVAPAVTLDRHPENALTLVRYILTEALIGLVLGIGVRLFVLALQTAGSIAAQATSLSQILGGAGAEPVPAMGYILTVGGLALAVIFGLHIHAARLLIVSYDIFPAGYAPSASDLSAWGVARIAHAFSLAFMLATPFVIGSVIYNLALGVINRAMPQLMVAFVGAPVITLGGLFLLFVSAPLMLSVWVEALIGFIQAPMVPPR